MTNTHNKYDIMDLKEVAIMHYNLYDKQRPNLKKELRLFYNDFNRMSSHMTGTIFGDDCSYFLNKRRTKATLFYKSGTKVALTRALYYNYIEDIPAGHNIKKICKNTGCLTLKHFLAYKRKGYK